MNILILISSYRKMGNTDLVAAIIGEDLQLAAKANNEPLVLNTLYLGHMGLEPCRGCRVCFDRGEEFCPIKDEFKSIKTAMKSADCIILAGPVYVDDVNGIMKNWIDRLAHVCHRPEFAGKSAYLLVTVGSSRTGHALRTMDTALRLWGFHIIGKAGLKTGAKTDREHIESMHGEKLSKVAAIIFTDLKKERFKNPSFISLMMFKIQQIGWSRAPQSTIDYQFWKEKGWLNGRQKFFIQPEGNFIKIGLARFVGTVVAKFLI